MWPRSWRRTHGSARPPTGASPSLGTEVDGRLLVHVECVQDLIDIDVQVVKPLFARRLFAQLGDWKGVVSREMLLPPVPEQVRASILCLHGVIIAALIGCPYVRTAKSM